MKYTKARK